MSEVIHTGGGLAVGRGARRVDAHAVRTAGRLTCRTAGGRSRGDTDISAQYVVMMVGQRRAGSHGGSRAGQAFVIGDLFTAAECQTTGGALADAPVQQTVAEQDVQAQQQREGRQEVVEGFHLLRDREHGQHPDGAHQRKQSHGQPQQRPDGG